MTSESNRKGTPPTRERILEASRTLFNANGVEQTAIMKIASAVKISPGNLTYHFNTKTDIVRELALRLEKGLHDNLFRMRAPFPPEQVVVSLVDLFKTFWRYRFLFNSGPFFYVTNPDAASIYQNIDGDLRAILMDYLTRVIAAGYVKAPGGLHGVRLLSDTMIAVWQQWLLSESMRTPHVDTPDASALRDVIARHVASMSPYLAQSYVQALTEEADRRLGPHMPQPLPEPSVEMQWRFEAPEPRSTTGAGPTPSDP